MLGSGLPGGAGPSDSYSQLGGLLTHKRGSRQSGGDRGGVTTWPGSQGECRHWRTQAGGRGRAGGGWLRTVGKALSMFCAWSRRWPLPSEQQTGLRGPGLRVSPSLGQERGGAFENLFSEPFTQWLSGPHFQKVPQLKEAVISTRMSVQQIMCTLGPLTLVRWPQASRQHLGLLPACRPFLVCVSPPGHRL